MKSLTSLLVLLIATTGTFGAPKCAPDPRPRTPLTSKALQQQIKVPELLKHATKLQEFSQRSGGTRAHGTEGYNASVAYIKQLLDATGFYNTEYQEIFSSSTTYTNVSLTDSSGQSFTYGDELVEMIDAPAGLVTAPLVIVNNLGCNRSDFPVNSTGSIVVIKRGTCFADEKLRLAKVAGAVGAIVYNHQPGWWPGSMLWISSSLAVPAVGLQQSPGEALVQRVLSTPGLTATINVEFYSENVTFGKSLIATTKGGDHDNVVFLGAHLDSVHDGPGINDNASGSVSILDLALKLSNFSFPNAVRFGWWAAEEAGLGGSTRYTRSLTAEERSKIALYLNFDMIASTNAGYFIYDQDCTNFIPSPTVAQCPSPEVNHIKKTFLEHFKQASNITALASSTISTESDHRPFADHAIPVGYLTTGARGFMTESQATLWGGKANVTFDSCYHQACDTVDNLNHKAWGIMTKGIAHALATYANSLAGIRKPTPRKQDTVGHGQQKPPGCGGGHHD